MSEQMTRTAREPKVLRVRTGLPAAAVAALSSVTLAGVAVLGFAPGGSGLAADGLHLPQLDPPGRVQVIGLAPSATPDKPGNTSHASRSATGTGAGTGTGVGVTVVTGSSTTRSPVLPTSATSPGTHTSGHGAGGSTHPGSQPSTTITVTVSRTTPPSSPPGTGPTTPDADQPVEMSFVLNAAELQEVGVRVASRVTNRLRSTSYLTDPQEEHVESVLQEKMGAVVADSIVSAASSAVTEAVKVSGLDTPPEVVSESSVSTFRHSLRLALADHMRQPVRDALAESGASDQVSDGQLTKAVQKTSADVNEDVANTTNAIQQIADQTPTLVPTTDGPASPSPTTEPTSPTSSPTTDPSSPTATDSPSPSITYTATSSPTATDQATAADDSQPSTAVVAHDADSSASSTETAGTSTTTTTGPATATETTAPVTAAGHPVAVKTVKTVKTVKPAKVVKPVKVVKPPTVVQPPSGTTRTPDGQASTSHHRHHADHGSGSDHPHGFAPFTEKADNRLSRPTTVRVDDDSASRHHHVGSAPGAHRDAKRAAAKHARQSSARHAAHDHDSSHHQQRPGRHRS